MRRNLSTSASICQSAVGLNRSRRLRSLAMARSGVLDNYQWVEIPDEYSDIPTVIRHLAGEIVGLIGVNVSWDSGRMVPTSEQETAGWRRVGDLAVSPTIDAALAVDWPASSCLDGRFDEWYFFRDVPESLELEAFCNYGGMSIEDAPELAYPGGLDLKAQLECYQPELVVGHGKHLFVISRRSEIIERVRGLSASDT